VLKKLCWTLISIFLPCFLSGQNLACVISYADSQLTMGNHHVALREYERALYFSHERNFQDSLYLKLADCYYADEDFLNAVGLYDACKYMTENKDLKISVTLKKACCYIRTYNFNMALVELLGLNDSLSSPACTERLFFLGITYFGLGKYAESEKCFTGCLAPDDSVYKENLHKIFLNTDKLRRLNPRKARAMSLVIPGSGQIYGGNGIRGINSLFLVGGLSILFYDIAVNYTLLDAFISVFPWWERYYTGGSRNAYIVTSEKLNRKKDKLYKEILSIIAASK
jgi:tetratricopeptide (TPR) repeat protein